MKYWKWQIPELYREYLIQLGREQHPLFDDFRKLQYTETGTLPQTFEIYTGVFLWRNYRHRIVYEKIPHKGLLVLVSLEQS